MRSRPAWVGLAALALLVALGPFGTAHAARGQTLDFTVGLRAGYDTNILQYSDNQLALFESGLVPPEFSIKTRDDLVWSPSLALNWEQSLGKVRKRNLRLRVQGNFFDRNPTADNRSLSVGWRETLRHDRRLSLSYYLLSDYYLRQLIDVDRPIPYPGLTALRYRRAQFDLHIGSLSYSQRLASALRVGGEYQFEHRGYDADFRERDSNLHQGSLGLEWSGLPRRGSVTLSGGYRHSDARAGTYVDPRHGGAAFYPDVSYHGYLAGANTVLELARAGSWRVGADLGYGLETRRYDSSHSSDRYHYGRHDVLNVMDVGLRFQYRPHGRLRGFYHFEHNRADLGAAAPPSADAGSYRDHQVGLALEWTGEVWSQTQAPSPSPEEEP